MEQTTYSDYGNASANREDHRSGVSWGAIAAGAFVAAGLSLTLLALGAGFELSTVSPWTKPTRGAPSVGTGALVWLIVVQIVACGMGGYLAGRLRTKWVAIHTHEVYFRDTAHGFLVWAVAVVMTAAFLGPAASVMAGSVASGSQVTDAENSRFVRLLFRPAPVATTSANAGAAIGTNPAMRHEAATALEDSLRSGEDTQADREYLTQLVTLATGLNPTDAGQRVSDVITRAQQAATAALKATARLLFWTFLALLLGAFCASYAATIGGRQRDHMPAV